MSTPVDISAKPILSMGLTLFTFLFHYLLIFTKLKFDFGRIFSSTVNSQIDKKLF